MWSTALDGMFIESAAVGYQLQVEPTHTVYINSPQDIFIMWLVTVEQVTSLLHSD
jgi:hypothetical protein